MEDTEVLIAGAGPVGIFLATELLRRGRRCVVLERNAGPSTHSKALALMPRTLEIFEIAGLGSRFLAELNRVDGVRFVTPRGCAYVGIDLPDTAYSFVGILPQWKTERLLRVRLRALGGEIRYGHEFAGLQESSDGVHAQVRTAQGTYSVRAQFLVGCDGVRSAVRDAAGIPFIGHTYPEGALLADLPVRTEIPRNEAHVHLHGGGMVTLFAMSESLRRMVIVAPTETLPGTASREWLQQRLRTAGYEDALAGEPEWTGTFRVHHRIARRMRAGRVFLAGDAAHTHSPVGGQGMNIGLHDAWNLGWKLAYVLEGGASEKLLDSYEAERLPIARRVVRRTDVLTRLLADPSGPARYARDALAALLSKTPALHRALLRRFSQLDVPYAKRMRNVRLPGGTSVYERIGGQHVLIGVEGRIVAVRPDGYIAYESRRGDPDAGVREAIERLRETGVRV